MIFFKVKKGLELSKVASNNSVRQNAEGAELVRLIRAFSVLRRMGCSTSEQGVFYVFDDAKFKGR